MKIAILQRALNVKGGPESLILWLSNELARRGHKITIFISKFNKSYWPLDSISGIKVEELPISEGINFDFLYWFKAGLYLRKRLNDYDLINTHDYPAYIWAYFARLFGCKLPHLVWYCHEPPGIYYKNIMSVHSPFNMESESLVTRIFRKWKEDKSAFFTTVIRITYHKILNIIIKPLRKVCILIERKAALSHDKVLTNSQYTALEVGQIYGIKAEPCLPGIPIHSNDSIEKRNKGDSKVILSVGARAFCKNIQVLLKALKIINSNGEIRNICLKIINPEDYYRKRLKEMAIKLGVESQVYFINLVSDEELDKLYKEASVVAHCCVNEHFGLVPLEAMARKIPVIASNHAGPLESVINGVTGFHVDPNDPEDVARRIVEILKDEKKAMMMGEEGYKLVLDKFTVSAFADRFEKLTGIKN